MPTERSENMKYIPLEKQSKKQQKAFYAARQLERRGSGDKDGSQQKGLQSKTGKAEVETRCFVRFCLFCGDKAGTGQAGEIRVFQQKQGLLSFHAAGVTCQTAVRADHPVTGDENGNGVVAHGTAYSLR